MLPAKFNCSTISQFTSLRMSWPRYRLRANLNARLSHQSVEKTMAMAILHDHVLLKCHSMFEAGKSAQTALLLTQD